MQELQLCACQVGGGSSHTSDFDAGSTIIGHGSKGLSGSDAATPLSKISNANSWFQDHARDKLTSQKAEQGKSSQKSRDQAVTERGYEIRGQDGPNEIVEQSSQVSQVSPRSMKEKDLEILEQRLQLARSRSPKREVEHSALSLDFLLQIFDEVDEDGTEFVARLDLRLRIDSCIERDPRAQSLSEIIKAMDCMILERDDFIDMVNNWLKTV